jgi:GT2 family glycosyltransferase
MKFSDSLPSLMVADPDDPDDLYGIDSHQTLPLSVMIVTYNSARLIDILLTQIGEEIGKLGAEVIVVDNASQDGTADVIEQRQGWVRLIRSPENLGFAAANNLAARHACGRLLLLLNPDALPEPGVISEAVDRMMRHQSVGLAGGRLLALDGTTQPSARMFPSLLNEWLVLSGLAHKYPKSTFYGRFDRTWADSGAKASVDWVPGAFAIVRASLFRALGGFDEKFFMYYEEVDLCRRIHDMGRKIAYWPSLRVSHTGGESAKTVEGQKVSKSGAQLTLWRARSGLIYYRKNHGWWTTFAVNRLERTWHLLRAWRGKRQGDPEKAAESAEHAATLKRAWNDTLGGRVSPPRPW